MWNSSRLRGSGTGKMPKFEMEIIDIFAFGGGRTAFVGSVTGEVEFIGPCKCELWAGDSLLATLDIDGQAILEPAIDPYVDLYDPYGEEVPRILTTTDPVSIEGENLPQGKYRLNCQE